MAPALIERTTEEAERQYNKDKRQTTYKEAFQQAPDTTKYETEINGSDTITPAKYPHYLPCKH